MSASLDHVAHGDANAVSGFVVALRRIRDPLLLGAVPITWAVLAIALGYVPAWGIGFDFIGTLWEPARALLDGESMYPAPVRESIVIGNPAVYPPPAVLLAMPLALLPQTLAAWLWFCVLGAAVFVALRIVGVRDWRCHVLALTSPVVVHGLTFGNITLLLVPAVAVAWRYREHARVDHAVFPPSPPSPRLRILWLPHGVIATSLARA